jgi:hypothetical protein
MDTEKDKNEWRELAIETIRNLDRVIEDMEAVRRRARERLEELDIDRDD